MQSSIDVEEGEERDGHTARSWKERESSPISKLVNPDHPRDTGRVHVAKQGRKCTNEEGLIVGFDGLPGSGQARSSLGTDSSLEFACFVYENIIFRGSKGH